MAARSDHGAHPSSLRSASAARPAMGSAPATAVASPRVAPPALPGPAGQGADLAPGGGDASAPGGDGPRLTGQDLVRFRAARSISQRGAAELLGVAHGTVAKAELLPDKPLAEQLERALKAVLPQ